MADLLILEPKRSQLGYLNLENGNHLKIFQRASIHIQGNNYWKEHPINRFIIGNDVSKGLTAKITSIRTLKNHRIDRQRRAGFGHNWQRPA
jgi:hypothetical protein